MKFLIKNNKKKKIESISIGMDLFIDNNILYMLFWNTEGPSFVVEYISLDKIISALDHQDCDIIKNNKTSISGI